MSDTQSPTEETGGESPRKKGTNPLRLTVLLLILGVALALLLFDYGIARPQFQKADAQIQGLLEGTIKDPNGDGTVTEDEVQTILGRSPIEVKDLPNGKMEVYHWRSVVPYRTYRLFVVYEGRTTPLLYSASPNQKPRGDKLPPTTQLGQPMTPEMLQNFVPPTISAAGTGGHSSPAGTHSDGGQVKQADDRSQGEPADKPKAEEKAETPEDDETVNQLQPPAKPETTPEGSDK